MARRGKKKDIDLSHDTQSESPSRSAKKRESAALQKLGEELLGLSQAARKELNLSPDLLEALALHDRISDREGGRRQRQFIGKLMRGEDYERISADLQRLQNLKAGEIAEFHAIEQWRDKFLSAIDNEIDEIAKSFARIYGDCPNLLKLRDMVSRAQKGKNTPGGVAASRALFRELAKYINNKK